MRNAFILTILSGRTALKCALTVMLAFSVSFLSMNSTYAKGALQEKQQITGKVIDGTTNESLPGVSILIKGTATGTITDMDGNFSMEAASSDLLVFSFIGYLSEEVTVGNSTEINVTLVEDIIGLDEVVVTGYGVQKKSDVTGSIASVSGDKLTEIPVSGVDQALQGRAAGVNVLSKSGRPGEETTIQIRGITSVNSLEPLIIVDGVRGSLGRLNPNDIESIEVLKDASSAAIYGVSGGSGVILVTTKKGRRDKMQTSFNFFSGIETPTKKLDLMNSQEWMQWVEERYYEDDNLNYRDTVYTAQPDTLLTHDWQDYAFESAWTQSYDLSFSGGSENSLFHVSASYFQQDGIVRNSDYRRFTMRVNTEHKLTKRITFDQKLFYSNTVTSGFAPNVWSEYYEGPFRPVLQMSPIVPDYNEDGTWANHPLADNNPLAKLDMIDRTEKKNSIDANLGLRIDIVKGLTFTSRFAGNLGFNDNKEFRDEYFNTVTDNRPVNKLINSMDRFLGYNAQQLLDYNFSIANSHNFSLLLGMEVRREWGYDINGERDDLVSPIPAMQYFRMSDDNSSASQIVKGNGFERRWLSYFGRLNYDYKSKYLLTANIRRDGVHNLDPKKRIGYFPSVSLGWKFTEEAFMKNQSVISFGKIRYGYGEVGNFPNGSGYPALSIVRKPDYFGYSFDNSDVSSVGASTVQIENPGLGWEIVHMSNIGVDLAFMQNRLSFTAEYYKQVNEDMIMLMDVPYVVGSFTFGTDYDIDNTNPTVNLGSIQNSGFEFTLGYRITSNDFKVSFDLNFSTLKNKVLSLATDSLLRGSVHNIEPICLTRVGGTVSEFYGWETDGMFTLDDPTTIINGNTVFTNQPFLHDVDGNPILDNNGDIQYAQAFARAGDARFKDVDGDGTVLTEKDKVFLGSPLPKFTFGFSVNMEYKNFDLSIFLNGTYGNKIFNGTKQYLYYYQGYNNHAASYADRYVENDIFKYNPETGENVLVVPANHNTDIFRDASTNYTKPTDFFIEDGSYIRLRNLVLGYTIPSKISKKIKLERLRFYVGAKNLFTITGYQGLNPEAAYSTENRQDDENKKNLDMGIDVGAYPVTRMFLFGVNLQF